MVSLQNDAKTELGPPFVFPKLVSWNIFCRGTTWYNSPFPYCPLRWCHNIISLWFTLPFQQACDRPWWSKSSSFIICRYLSYMLSIIFLLNPMSSLFILFHPFSSPFELGGWGWSHPFSSGPGIFLYKMTWLNLQNGLPGNFSTKCLALDRLSHYKMSAEHWLKQGWFFSSKWFSKAVFNHFLRPNL